MHTADIKLRFLQFTLGSTSNNLMDLERQYYEWMMTKEDENPTIDDIEGISDMGKALLSTTGPEHVRTTIGAGTSNLSVGTTASTAKKGDYTPTWPEVTNKPTMLELGVTSTTAKAGDYTPTWAETRNKPPVIAAGDNASAARASIGAGTSSVVIGTGPTDAKSGDYQPSVATTAVAGVVKQVAAHPNVTVTLDLNAVLTSHNSLLAKLRTAGILAP